MAHAQKQSDISTEFVDSPDENERSLDPFHSERSEWPTAGRTAESTSSLPALSVISDRTETETVTGDNQNKAGQPDEVPKEQLPVPPQLDGAQPPGAPRPGGLPLAFRPIDTQQTWNGLFQNQNATNMMAWIGPGGQEFLKTLDHNAPLRLNSIPNFMSTNTAQQRAQIIANVKKSLHNDFANNLHAEDAESDPTRAHRQRALRFMLSADAKIRLDQIMMQQKPGQELDAEQRTEIKNIVKNLLKEEREIAQPFDDFLNGYNDSPVKVTVEGEPRFGLPAGECSIRELVDREKVKTAVRTLEQGVSANSDQTPNQMADQIQLLIGLSQQEKPSPSAKKLLEGLAKNGIDPQKLVSDLRSNDPNVAKEALKCVSKGLPEIKYAALSPSEVCKTIPPDLLKEAVRDEEKRLNEQYKALTRPLLDFCAGTGGRPLSPEQRTALIAAATQAAKKEGVGSDTCDWMSAKDAQLQFLEATSPEAALRVLRSLRNSADAGNIHANRLLESISNHSQDVRKQLDLKEDPLDVLGRPGSPEAAAILQKLKDATGKYLDSELGDKGARAVLSDLTKAQTADDLERKAEALEPFTKKSPYAADRQAWLKAESIAVHMKLATGQADKLQARVDQLIKECGAGNKYAKAMAAEMLIPTSVTKALNLSEDETGKQGLVPSYELKLENLLGGDNLANAALVKSMRQKLVDNTLNNDISSLDSRQIAILSHISSKPAKVQANAFDDQTTGIRIANVLSQKANEGKIEQLAPLANGIYRSLKLSNEKHENKIASTYLTCVERGALDKDSLRMQYARMVELAETKKNHESVRILAGLVFEPVVQDCQLKLEERRVQSPKTELTRLYEQLNTKGSGNKEFAGHIQNSVKEFTEPPIAKEEAHYPEFMLRFMESMRKRSTEQPPPSPSAGLVEKHCIASDLYKGLAMKDQSDYHAAEAQEIRRAEKSLKIEKKPASGDPVKDIVEEILALSGKLSIEANGPKFKVSVADNFLLQCLEQCPGLRIPLGIRDAASGFKGFELSGDEIKFSGKAQVPVRAGDVNFSTLGVDRIADINLDNTSAKISVDPTADRLTLKEIKGLSIDLKQSSAAALDEIRKTAPAEDQFGLMLASQILKSQKSVPVIPESVEIELKEQPSGDSILSLKAKVLVNGALRHDIGQEIAIPKQQAAEIKKLIAEFRKPVEQRNSAKYLQDFIAAGLDDRFKSFISKFDSFSQTNDGGFKATKKEEGTFDLGNIQLLVGKEVSAKVARTEDTSIVRDIKGLSAKLPLPDSLAEQLKLKDPVGITELRIGDLKNNKRKIVVETDSIYKRIEIELDGDFKPVRDTDNNIAVKIVMAKDGKELAVTCKANPESIAQTNLLKARWSIDLQGAAELKEELLNPFLKELSPLAGKIERVSNTPTETKLRLSEETKFDMKGIQLKFDKEVSLTRAGIRADGGFTAKVQGIEVTRFGDGGLYRWIYGSKSLLKPQSIDWKPNGEGQNGQLAITPSKDSAINEMKVDVDKSTYRPVAGSMRIDNPLEAATSPGSTAWSTVTVEFKANEAGELKISNQREAIASATLKALALNAMRPVRLLITGVKAIASLFD